MHTLKDKPFQAQVGDSVVTTTNDTDMMTGSDDCSFWIPLSPYLYCIWVLNSVISLLYTHYTHLTQF